MSKSSRPRKSASPSVQRNALAPALIAAVSLLAGAAVLEGGGFTIVRFLVSILALVVCWFAIQAHHWWWAPVFLAIAVVWNPVLPLPFEGQLWLAAQYLAALAFVTAGVMIKVPRAAEEKPERGS